MNAINTPIRENPVEETKIRENPVEETKNNIKVDLYDDVLLKPNENIDSPYGFVFFPNKYWKQWGEKAPVCVPTSSCLVQPSLSSGVPVDALDYTQIGSIMPKFEYREEYS
jgi:hypothetical protein